MWPLGQCNTTPPVIKQINPCKWTDATVPIVQWTKIYEEAKCDDANTHFMTQRQSRQDHYMHHLQDGEKKKMQDYIKLNGITRPQQFLPTKYVFVTILVV